MTFDEFKSSVVTRANVAAGYAATKAPADDGRTDKVLAACAIVIAERGEFWCRANPAAFHAAVKSELGTWVGIVMGLASLFLPGAGIWLTLMKWIVPAVLEFLHQRRAVAGYTATSDFASVADEAAIILKGRQ